MRITALVITYNSLIENSKIIPKLSGKSDCSIAIIDNSDIDFVKKNEKYSVENGINYIAMNDNVGLSRAYNYALKNIKSDYFIIFDDDTIITNTFIDDVKQNILKYDADLYFPIVYSVSNKQKIIRPYILSKRIIKIIPKYPLKYFDFDKIEEFEKNKNLKTINSGMVIKNSNDVYFNENLFLGFVDTDFCERMIKLKKKIKIIDTPIYQSFSEETRDLESYKNRYKVAMNDYIVYYNKLVLFRSVLLLTVRFKSLFFIKEFCKLVFMNKGGNDGEN